jgi:ribonuclease inhibitor
VPDSANVKHQFMPREKLITIDLTYVTESKALQLLLMERLNFPGWYGCNWNAFWDGITGLVEMPEVLSLVGWSIMEARLPHDAKLMKECLDDMAKQYPDIAPICEYR